MDLLSGPHQADVGTDLSHASAAWDQRSPQCRAARKQGLELMMYLLNLPPGVDGQRRE